MTDELTKALTEFSDFINEPPQYEDKRMVRDYRHELAGKWIPVFEAIQAALAATPAGLNQDAADQPAFDNPRDPFASPDRMPATPAVGGERETCIDCDKREPCDDDCPNYQDQEVSTSDREMRTGAHLLQMAKSLGWPDDGEGALEFMLRRAREVAFEDCAAQPASPLRGRQELIEQCALIAEGFDAACDSPRMKLFVEAGLVQAIYKRDGEIGAAIRALSASPPEQPAAAPKKES